MANEQGWGSYLLGLPGKVLPSADSAGRAALTIWAASQGPQALLGVSDYFRQLDLQQYKTVSDPDYQDYVKQLEKQNTENGMDPASARRDAISAASKVFVGAKGFVPPEATENVPLETLPSDVMGPPQSKLISMPQLPPVDSMERMKSNIAKAQKNMWDASGPEADAFRQRTTFGTVGADTAAQIYDGQLKNAEILGARYPGQEISTKYGKSGPEYSGKPRDPNFVPKTLVLYDKDGTPVPIDASAHPAFTDKQMDPVFGADGNIVGYTNKGFLPQETARQNVVGTSEGKYGKPDSYGPEGAGKVTRRLRPGMSPADKDAEAKLIDLENKRDQARVGRAEAATDEASSVAIRAEAALGEFQKAAGVVDENGNVNYKSKNAIWPQYEPPSYEKKVAVDLAKGGPSAPEPKIREKNFVQRRAVDLQAKKYEYEQWYRAQNANVRDNYMLGVYYGLEGPVATLTARIFGDTKLSNEDREAFKAALPSYLDYGRVAEEKFKRLPSVVQEIANRARAREQGIKDEIGLKSVESAPVPNTRPTPSPDEQDAEAYLKNKWGGQ